MFSALGFLHGDSPNWRYDLEHKEEALGNGIREIPGVQARSW